MGGKFHTLWANLSDRQKLAAITIGGWAGAWGIAKILDTVSAQMPGWVPVTMLARIFETVVLSGYVLMFLAGVALIAFGPNAISYVRKVGSAKWNAIFLSGILLVGVSAVLLLLLIVIYESIFYAPRVFGPPMAALKDSDGTVRKFSAKSPLEIERPFAYDTLLRAQRSLDSERGLWIAITGVINDVSVNEDRSLSVSLAAENTSEARLHFEDKWQQRFADLPRGERVYAVCKITDAARSLLVLDACELTQP